MARGILAGMIAGTLVSGLVLGGISVLTGAPHATSSGRSPEAESVEVPPGSQFDLRHEDREAALPAVQQPPAPAEVPKAPPPAPDDTGALRGADIAPAVQPETGVADGLGGAPEIPEAGTEFARPAENPVLPSPQAAAPAVPAADAPAQAGQDDPAAGLAAQDDPVFPVEEPAPVPLPGANADESGAAEPVAPDEGAISELAQEAGEAPARTLPTAGIIENRAEGVTTGRLPTVPDGPVAQEAEEAAPATEPEPQGAAQDGPRGALVSNAAAFDNPDGKPLMAVVLMDDGTHPVDSESLARFPFPLNVAVDVDSEHAAEAAARHRAAGFEVLAMIDMPEGAGAADAEVAMQTWLARVPQAVAVLEGTGSGLQSSREASAQLAPILQETGHGLVMHPNGLNTAQKLMTRAGVPSASLFRDFDGQGQDEAAMRRFLDQAAMRAGRQEEGVIVLGRLRKETLDALLVWGLEGRGGSVALAPVSAVLLAE